MHDMGISNSIGDNPFGDCTNEQKDCFNYMSGINDDSRLPVRTANLLPVQVAPGDPTMPLLIRTTIEPVGDAPLEPGAFAGILFGAGGPAAADF